MKAPLAIITLLISLSTSWGRSLPSLKQGLPINKDMTHPTFLAPPSAVFEAYPSAPSTEGDSPEEKEHGDVPIGTPSAIRKLRLLVEEDYDQLGEIPSDDKDSSVTEAPSKSFGFILFSLFLLVVVVLIFVGLCLYFGKQH